MQCLLNWGQQMTPVAPPGPGGRAHALPRAPSLSCPQQLYSPKTEMIFKNKWIYFTMEYKSQFGQKRGEKKKKLCKPKTSVSLVYGFLFLYSYKQLEHFHILILLALSHMYLHQYYVVFYHFLVFEGCLIFMGWMYHSLHNYSPFFSFHSVLNIKDNLLIFYVCCFLP